MGARTAVRARAERQGCRVRRHSLRAQWVEHVGPGEEPFVSTENERANHEVVTARERPFAERHVDGRARLIARVIERGMHDTSIRLEHPLTDKGYSYLLHEYACTTRGCTKTYHQVRIIFIVNWFDGERNHGQLRTMYCKGMYVCPSWVSDDGAYLGP